MIDEASIRIEGAGRSHVGRVRELNEDSLCARPDIGLWAVADGMGGHEHGERASAAIVAALDAVPADGDFDGRLGHVADAIHAANATIHAEGSADGSHCGSTVVALLVGEGRFGVAWAGDSRAYLLRDGRLYQLTTDHTQVQEMVDRGLLTPDAAKGHPMGHVLARAVGVAERLELDVVSDELAAGDRFLICSDGLTGLVSDAEITGAMQAAEGDALVGRLIDLCLERGAPDNVTIAVVEVRAATQLIFGEATHGE